MKAHLKKRNWAFGRTACNADYRKLSANLFTAWAFQTGFSVYIRISVFNLTAADKDISNAVFTHHGPGCGP